MKRFKRGRLVAMILLAISLVIPQLPPVLGNVNVTQVEAASKVKLNKSTVTIYVGKTYTLKLPGTSAAATWKSSKTSVATVSKSGKVTAKTAGTTKITATVGKESDTCIVTVKDNTVVYGKVTAIKDTKFTLALGTLKEQKGSVSTGQPGESTEMLDMNGETVTITISDPSILFKTSIQDPSAQSFKDTTAEDTVTKALLTDITIGNLLKVTYTSGIDKLISVIILGGSESEDMIDANTPDSTTGDNQPDSVAMVTTGTGANNLNHGDVLTGVYTSTKADENVIRAEGVISAIISDVTASKDFGAASNSDASNFYGLNSAILALKGAKLNITGGKVTALAEGANGVFAYDGAIIDIMNTVIDVSGDNAGGIDVAGGGTISATNLKVNSKSKAAIRSGRGGGNILVFGGTYTTSGSYGAPVIYSTAKIAVNNATLTANSSEAIVVEGMNSVSLNDCVVAGNMSGTYGATGGENIHNVMLYQSMSGDAEVGSGSFSMTNGNMTSLNGDMFYVTNTDCVIKLSSVSLKLADKTKLLVVAGNDGTGGWGKPGSNGGNCTLTTSYQNLKGDISVDSISKLKLNIKDASIFTGAINADKTTAASLSVTMDESSNWTLTADSYITDFEGNLSKVNKNGYILYINGIAKK